MVTFGTQLINRFWEKDIFLFDVELVFGYSDILCWTDDVQNAKSIQHSFLLWFPFWSGCICIDDFSAAAVQMHLFLAPSHQKLKVWQKLFDFEASGIWHEVFSVAVWTQYTSSLFCDVTKESFFTLPRATLTAQQILTDSDSKSRATQISGNWSDLCCSGK